ncbi:hypothetical protein D9M69_496090 [compost metagenome]
MKSRIWRLAGVGLLCVSVSVQAMADEPQNRGHDGGQRGQGGHQGDNQGRGGGDQPHPQNDQQQNQPRAQNKDNRQKEHGGQNQRQDNDQRQSRPAPDFNNQVRSPPPPPCRWPSIMASTCPGASTARKPRITAKAAPWSARRWPVAC